MRTITRYTTRAEAMGRVVRFEDDDGLFAEGHLSRASLMAPATLRALDESWNVVIEPTRRIAPSSWRVLDENGATLARIRKELLAHSAQVSCPADGEILELRPPDGAFRDLAKRAVMLHSTTTLLLVAGEVVGSLGTGGREQGGLGHHLAALGKSVMNELRNEWTETGSMRVLDDVANDAVLLSVFLFVREVIDRERAPG